MRCFAITLAVLLLSASAVFAGSFDVSDSAPPPVRSGFTMYERNSPLVEKYSLLIMPPCQSSGQKNPSDLTVQLISQSGFEESAIKMINDSIVEMRLKSTGDIQYNNIESGLRFPHSFKLWVVFDADTAVYNVYCDLSKDSFQVTEDSRNKKVRFIYLEPIKEIPADYSWIMFSGGDGKWLREFRDRMPGKAKFKTLKEGYYKCLPSYVKKTKLAKFTVNQVDGMIMQFFKLQGGPHAGLDEMIRRLPHMIAYQLN